MPIRSRRGALLLPCLLLLAACSGAPNTADATGSEGTGSGGVRVREATKVVAQHLERRDMEQILETTAVLEADREVPVVARSAGQVVEILAEEGDAVGTGDELAHLDSRAEELALRDAEIALEEANQALATAEIQIEEAKSAVENSKSALAQAERDLARDEQLFTNTEGGVTLVAETTLEKSRLARDQAIQDLAQKKLAQERVELDRDKARTTVSRAEVTRDRAKRTLELMTLVAPFDGVVSLRSIKPGQNLAGGEQAFVVTDPTRLRVVFYRPQREFGLFSSQADDNLAITATTEALDRTEFSGHVERIAPTIDATSGSFRITARIERVPRDDGPERLLPGMLLRLAIVTDRHEGAITVPKRAVVREGDQAFLFTVDRSGEQAVARRRLVREGFGDATHVEVTALEGDELTTDDLVVVIGARDLADGDPLQVEER
ncbi:MAG: efflux RND transporter periplasmic adaptor subunit [Planctomycetota bacterium]